MYGSAQCDVYTCTAVHTYTEGMCTCTMYGSAQCDVYTCTHTHSVSVFKINFHLQYKPYMYMYIYTQ